MTLTKRQIEHREFLKSPEWAKIRDHVLTLRHHKCEKCKTSKDLQVHHLNYDRWGGDELPSDLMVLCRKHHMSIHGLKPEKKKRMQMVRNEFTLTRCRERLNLEYQISKKKNKSFKKLARALADRIGGTIICEDYTGFVIDHMKTLPSEKRSSIRESTQYKNRVILRKPI